MFVWLIFWVTLVILVGAIVLGQKNKGYYGMDEGYLATALISGLVFVFAAGGLAINHLDQNYQEGYCAKFGAQSGYETRFVEYGYWTRECLAKTPSGKWVNVGNIQQNDVVVTNGEGQ